MWWQDQPTSQKEKTDSSLQHRRFVIVCVYYIFISMLYLWCTHIPYIYVHQGWGTAKDLQNDGKKHTAVNTKYKTKAHFHQLLCTRVHVEFEQFFFHLKSRCSVYWWSSQGSRMTSRTTTNNGRSKLWPLLSFERIERLWEPHGLESRLIWKHTKLTLKWGGSLQHASLGRCWGIGSPCHSLCETHM